MIRPLPRNQLPQPKQKFTYRDPVLMKEIEYGVSCVTCQENAKTCVYIRRSGKAECLNCWRKRTVHRQSPQKAWLWEHKRSSGCIICGENDPACLEFHHMHPRKKKFSIGSVPPQTPKNIVFHEIQKCVVLCANCHSKVDHE